MLSCSLCRHPFVCVSISSDNTVESNTPRRSFIQNFSVRGNLNCLFSSRNSWQTKCFLMSAPKLSCTFLKGDHEKANWIGFLLNSAAFLLCNIVSCQFYLHKWCVNFPVSPQRNNEHRCKQGTLVVYSLVSAPCTNLWLHCAKVHRRNEQTGKIEPIISGEDCNQSSRDFKQARVCAPHNCSWQVETTSFSICHFLHPPQLMGGLISLQSKMNTVRRERKQNEKKNMEAASAFEAGMQYRITSFYCGQDNSPFCPVYKGGRRPLMGRSAATAAPAASLHCYSPYLPCLVAAHTRTHSAEGYCVAPFCAKSLRLTKKKKNTQPKSEQPGTEEQIWVQTILVAHICKNPGSFQPTRCVLLC